MPQYTTIRDVLEERKTRVYHDEAIATTEDFIKYEQDWPVNQKEEHKPKQMSSSEKSSKRREALARINSEQQFSSKKYISVPFMKRQEVNQDTRIYTFKHSLGSIDAFNIEIGQHILCGFMLQDGIVERPYAVSRPTGADKDDGTIDIVVKTIFPDEKSPGGLISNLMDSLDASRGDEMLIRGPEGPIRYRGNGKFSIMVGESANEKEVTASKVNFISGGTGMTPIWATLKAMMETDISDLSMKVKFMDANTEKGEILLEKELNDLADKSGRLDIIHVLEKAEKGWSGEVGLVDEAKMRKHLYPPGDGCITIVCGPPPMLKAAGKGLRALGFREDEDFFHY